MANKINKISDINWGLPNLTNALRGWEVPIIADYIKQEEINGDIVNISEQKRIRGVLQPLKAQEVNLKPEGQRAWSWYELHISPEFKELQVEQYVHINGNKYKIMAVKNYDMYGYLEYHCVRGYDD